MAKISPMMAVPVVVFAGFIGLALVGMMREDPNSLPSARVGKISPTLTMDEFPGKPQFTDETLRDGRVKLVNFWASWCAPCRAEHPLLERLSEEGVQINGINYKDDPANAKRFLAQLGNPYAALMADADGRTGLEWGLYGVPETFVIASDGTVVKRFAGPITEGILESIIRPAIAEAETR